MHGTMRIGAALAAVVLLSGCVAPELVQQGQDASARVAAERCDALCLLPLEARQAAVDRTNAKTERGIYGCACPAVSAAQ